MRGEPAGGMSVNAVRLPSPLELEGNMLVLWTAPTDVGRFEGCTAPAMGRLDKMGWPRISPRNVPVFANSEHHESLDGDIDLISSHLERYGRLSHGRRLPYERRQLGNERMEVGSGE